MTARRLLIAALLLILVAGARAQTARADGDPGSDVLVYQPLFLASDAGISIKQQVRLDDLLRQAGRRGFAIRVAIISGPSDLGSVTALWRKPRAYARFLGIELSLAYKGRLLVVMPNGFGFNWPGHPTAAAYRALGRLAIGSGGTGLADATQNAVRALAAADGVKLTASLPPSSGTAPAAAKNSSSASASPRSSGEVGVILGVLAALCAVAAAMGVAPRWRQRRKVRREERARAPLLEPILRERSRTVRRTLRPSLALAGVLTVASGATVVALVLLGAPSTAQSDALARNPNLDPGTSLSRPAPDFTLTDQFGQPVSLRSLRGKVVLLAFTDSECTTICPLTTTAMLDAKAMLGAAGSRVQLLGIDADPKATALDDVLSYSRLHGMLSAWHFLTGSLAQLKAVWKAYGIEAAVQGGEIAHTPALFVIDTRGREEKLYMTQQSYAAIGQLGQLLAQEASRLLPGHPPVDSHLSYSQIPGISPAAKATLPKSGGGSVPIGPGRSPRLYLFFATWDQEVTSLGGQLEALNRYEAAARSSQLPPLTAIDEGSVEPSSRTLPSFLAALPRRLSYPVAIDRSGRVADGYEVQGEPWFVLTTPSGRIIWYWEVSTSGWLGTTALAQHVRAALARAPRAPASAAAALQQLAGSPPALAAIHHQASRLLGSAAALRSRLRALHGYPIVLNAWASWCTPCRAEASLFASASVRYGRRVAFLGADTDDSGGDAAAFLAQHPVSYPSYQITMSELSSIAPQGIGLPRTIFINRAGKIVYVHIGEYDSGGSLDADIQNYAMGGQE